MRFGQPRAASLPTGPLLAAARGGLVVLLLVGWQTASGTLIDPLWVSDPLSIGRRLANWVETGFLAFHLSVTLQEALLGFVVGTIAGVSAGTALGVLPYMAKLLDPF